MSKSNKDCAEINDRYRKLMKEESELLSDLKKLQVKKQLLVKRSKQLRDEQVIKLNLDLQKEKAIRGDLEKKLCGLEKKLNQLEKEIDARNRDKQLSRNSKSSESVKKSPSSAAEIKANKEAVEKEKNLKKWPPPSSKESKSSAASSLQVRKEPSKPTGTLACTVATQSGQCNPTGRSSQLNATVAIDANQINTKQVSKQSTCKTSVLPESCQSLAKSTTNLQPNNQANLQSNLQSPKSDGQLTKKTAIKSQAEQLPKINVAAGAGLLPKTTHNGETNTQSLPKEQQLIRSNVNSLIRLMARQNNNSTSQQPTSNPPTSNPPISNSPISNPTASNPLASNPPTNQPKASAIPAQNSDTLSNSSTTVNYSSPSSSGNSSFEQV